MSAPFHQTRMGQRYYEHTVPELVRQLTRLNDLLERSLGDGVAGPSLRRFVVTCVPRDAGEGDWFVVDRRDEEPAILAGSGPDGRRRAGALARELEEGRG